jgi:hypothetical protein
MIRVTSRPPGSLSYWIRDLWIGCAFEALVDPNDRDTYLVPSAAACAALTEKYGAGVTVYFSFPIDGYIRFPKSCCQIIAASSPSPLHRIH